MTVFSGFLDHLGHLVHPDVRSSDLDRARHRTFLVTRLGLAFTVLLGSVLALVFGLVPGMWEAMAVMWLTIPFVAACHVARTGRLAEGEAACLAAWWGLAVSSTLAGGTSPIGGFVLLLVMPLEAGLTDQPRLVHRGLVAACLGAVVIGLGLLAGAPHRLADASTVGDLITTVPALLYLVVLARLHLSTQHREQQLARRGEERYRVLSEAVGDLVLRYDRQMGVVMASKEAEALFGIAPRDLLGRGFIERVLVTDRPACLKLFADAAASESTMAARLRFRASSPDEARGAPAPHLWVELRARRFDPDAADVAGREGEAPSPAVAVVVRDITAQVEHERAIQDAKQDAERQSSWKDTFLANVSHELRTPLNAIIGFSEMLSNAEFSPHDPEKQRDYARIITSSGQHLLSVVNSLLDISKIEAGCFSLDPESFALPAMIGGCCEMVGLNAEQGGVSLSRHLDPSLGEIVGDKRACRQIIINLLSNALKFTPAGGHVTIDALPERGGVLLRVADTGVGIAARDMKRLGDAFFQAKSGLDRPYEGTGLGLSVVRGLVGLHGGRITVASAPGQGTEVTVWLPQDCRASAPVEQAKIETISRHSCPQPELNRGLAQTQNQPAPLGRTSKVA